MKLFKKESGFTLIEIMIVVAVVGILAAMAYPSYQESLTKSRRSDARAALSAAVMEQEKWYFQFNGYTDDVDDIGGVGGILLSPEGFYQIAINNNSGAGTCVGGGAVRFNCFTLTATPVVGGIQADDAVCTSFSITHTGVTSALGSNPTLCW